mmetsp:Transcript_8499/g.12370  ORF Transcript_8499/g.12370 Transcript_8499/m.12370 type:complete len:590 (-) Transcript_8499:238-2007(-)
MIGLTSVLLSLTLLGAKSFTVSPSTTKWGSRYTPNEKCWCTHAPKQHSSTNLLELHERPGGVDMDSDPNYVDQPFVQELIDAVNQLREEMESASERAKLAEERVVALQMQVESAERELKEKEQLLADNERSQSKEKETLMTRLAEITKFAKNNDKEMKEKTEAVKREAKQRQEELETEILSLKLQLSSAEEVLQEEQEARNGVLSRLENAGKMLEDEQIRFENEKIDLNERIVEEKQKLTEVDEVNKYLEEKIEESNLRQSEIEAELETERNFFNDEKSKLEDMVQDGERERSLMAKKKSAEYSSIRKELTALWNSAKNEARRSDRKRRKQVAEMIEEIVRLEADIKDAKAASDDLKRVQEALRRVRDDALEEKSQMESRFNMTLAERDDTIAEIEKNISALNENEINLKQAVNGMEEKSNEDDEQLSQLRTELQNQKNIFKEKEIELRQKIEYETRVRELAVEAMEKKNKKTQEDLSLKLKAEKSVAKKELGTMRENYDDQIMEKDRTIADLKNEVAKVTRESIQYAALAEKIKLTRDDSLKEAATLESGLLERNEQITRYETKYREVLKLSVKLTAKRIGNLIRRNK